jgi:hypothetical protein
LGGGASEPPFLSKFPHAHLKGALFDKIRHANLIEQVSVKPSAQCIAIGWLPRTPYLAEVNRA